MGTIYQQNSNRLTTNYQQIGTKKNIRNKEINIYPFNRTNLEIMFLDSKIEQGYRFSFSGIAIGSLIPKAVLNVPERMWSVTLWEMYPQLQDKLPGWVDVKYHLKDWLYHGAIPSNKVESLNENYDVMFRDGYLFEVIKNLF